MCPSAAWRTPDKSLPGSQCEYREGKAPAEPREGTSSRFLAAQQKLRPHPNRALNDGLRQTRRPSGTEILSPVITVDDPEDWTCHDIVASGDL